MFGSKELVQVTIGSLPDEVARKSFGQLNPASTTSSLERIEAQQTGPNMTQPHEDSSPEPKKSLNLGSEDIKIEQA